MFGGLYLGHIGQRMFFAVKENYWRIIRTLWMNNADQYTDLLSLMQFLPALDILTCTVLVKIFAHLNRNFFLASLEEIGKLLH